VSLTSDFAGDTDARGLPPSVCRVHLRLTSDAHSENVLPTLHEMTRGLPSLTALEIVADARARVRFYQPIFAWIAPECQLRRLHIDLPYEATFGLDAYAGLGRQEALTHLQFDSTWTNAGLEWYSRMPAAPRLRHLSLPRLQLNTPAVAEALARFASLETLVANTVRTMPPILPCLRRVRLRVDDVVDASHLALVLAESTRLTDVRLWASHMTHADVAHLVRALPHLVRLHLRGMRALAPLTCLAGARLSHLTLYYCDGLSVDADLAHLRSPTLRSLDVRGSMNLRQRRAQLAPPDWPRLVDVKW
jgi:hypothetical protein